MHLLFVYVYKIQRELNINEGNIFTKYRCHKINIDIYKTYRCKPIDRQFEGFPDVEKVDEAPH